MSVASGKRLPRVMETLVVSAKPSRILVGKILGMGVLGLLQMLMFLVVRCAWPQAAHCRRISPSAA